MDETGLKEYLRRKVAHGERYGVASVIFHIPTAEVILARIEALEAENEALEAERDQYYDQAVWFAGQAGEAHRKLEELGVDWRNERV